MSLFRTAQVFSRRASPFLICKPAALRALSTSPPRLATGYGDGKGDPRGENPQDQGASNNAKQHAEHPGPDPPAAGKGTGAGPTKGGSNTSKKSPADASAASGGSRSKEAKETGSSPTGGKIGGGENGGKSQNDAEPKIQRKNTPEASEGKQAEVEKHNREFEKRHDRAQPAEDDKVDKKFWEGELLRIG